MCEVLIFRRYWSKSRPKKAVEPGDGDHVRDGSTFKILHQLNIRGPKDEEKIAVSWMYLRWPLEENNGTKSR